MYLLQSWRESLLFLKPENIKLLFLVTLRTIYKSYKFFMLIFMLFVLFEPSLWQFLLGVNVPLFQAIQRILLVDLFFVFVLVARPSIKRKTHQYFLDYNWHFTVWFLIPLLIIPFFEFVLKVSYLPTRLVVLIFPIEVFLILFWLDSRCSIKNLFLSLLRAIKMFVFNFPFCLLFFIFPFFIFSLSKFVIPVAIFKYLEAIVFVIYICFFTNFYIKRLHDQFNLYFKT